MLQPVGTGTALVAETQPAMVVHFKFERKRLAHALRRARKKLHCKLAQTFTNTICRGFGLIGFLRVKQQTIESVAGKPGLEW